MILEEGKDIFDSEIDIYSNLWVPGRSPRSATVFLFQPGWTHNLLYRGPVHTYPDIFESATFSFRIQKFLRPHVAYSNRILPSTRIRWYPDSL